MATHEELTVGILRRYLEAFQDGTKVVLGQPGTSDVAVQCHANTYYPPGGDFAVWVVLDHGTSPYLEAKSETVRGDWISVQDEPPPLGEAVLFVSVLEDVPDVSDPLIGEFTGDFNKVGCAAMEVGDEWLSCTHWRAVPDAGHLITKFRRKEASA